MRAGAASEPGHPERHRRRPVGQRLPLPPPDERLVSVTVPASHARMIEMGAATGLSVLRK